MGIRIEITLDGDTNRRDVLGMIDMMKAYDERAMLEQIAAESYTDAIIKPSAIQEPEVILPAGDVNSEAEDAAMDQIPQAPAAKGKRGRPRKTEVAAEPVDPSPASSETPMTQTVEPLPEPSPSESTTKSEENSTDAPLKSHTLDELRGALMAFAAKHGEDGIQKGITLLGTFGLARVSEMVDQPVEVQAKFMAACNA